MDKNSQKHQLLSPAGSADEPLLLRPARAARLLDCSRSKIYDAISKGQITSVRVAGMLRISIREIERLARQSIPGDPTSK